MRMLPLGNVLAVGAHCDDIEIGCGGILSRLARLGFSVHGLVVTDTHYKRDQVVLRDGEIARAEAHAAARVIGFDPIFGSQRNNSVRVDEELVFFIRGHIERHNITTVFTHWDGDAHLDHVRVARATIMAARDTPNLFMYRSNRFRTVRMFPANLMADISGTMSIKMDALRCYKSEIDRVGADFLEHVEVTNRADGCAVGARYAEAFCCVKLVL